MAISIFDVNRYRGYRHGVVFSFVMYWGVRLSFILSVVRCDCSYLITEFSLFG